MRKQTWQQLTRSKDIRMVTPARAFREQSSDYFQIIGSDGCEHIAVRGERPYGAHVSLPGAVGRLLLHQEASGVDYRLFAVPAEMLSLQQVSAGANYRANGLLRNLYRRTGQSLSQLIDAVPIPPLQLEDFGVEKRTGRLALLPPTELGVGTTEPVVQLESMANSIAQLFGGHVPATAYEALIDEFALGLTG